MITQSGYMFCKYGGLMGTIGTGLMIAPNVLATYNGEESIGGAIGSGIGTYLGGIGADTLYNHYVKPTNLNAKFYQKIPRGIGGLAASIIGAGVGGTVLRSVGNFVNPYVHKPKKEIHPLDWATNKITSSIIKARGDDYAFPV